MVDVTQYVVYILDTPKPYFGYPASPTLAAYKDPMRLVQVSAPSDTMVMSDVDAGNVVTAGWPRLTSRYTASLAANTGATISSLMVTPKLRHTRTDRRCLEQRRPSDFLQVRIDQVDAEYTRGTVIAEAS